MGIANRAIPENCAPTSENIQKAETHFLKAETRFQKAKIPLSFIFLVKAHVICVGIAHIMIRFLGIPENCAPTSENIYLRDENEIWLPIDMKSLSC